VSKIVSGNVYDIMIDYLKEENPELAEIVEKDTILNVGISWDIKDIKMEARDMGYELNGLELRKILNGIKKISESKYLETIRNEIKFQKS